MTQATEGQSKYAREPVWGESRLRRHSDYQRVYAGSRKQFSATMTYFFVVQPDARGDSPARVGLTAGRVLGKAVERNRIKRRMREVVRRHLSQLPPGVDVVLHPRKNVMTMDFGALDREVETVFARIAERLARRPSESRPAPCPEPDGPDVGARP
jgi:ribonuclease P protein component